MCVTLRHQSQSLSKTFWTQTAGCGRRTGTILEAKPWRLSKAVEPWIKLSPLCWLKRTSKSSQYTPSPQKRKLCKPKQALSGTITRNGTSITVDSYCSTNLRNMSKRWSMTQYRTISNSNRTPLTSSELGPLPRKASKANSATSLYLTWPLPHRRNLRGHTLVTTITPATSRFLSRSKYMMFLWSDVESRSELERTAQFRYDTVFEQAIPSEVMKVKQKPEAV